MKRSLPNYCTLTLLTLFIWGPLNAAPLKRSPVRKKHQFSQSEKRRYHFTKEQDIKIQVTRVNSQLEQLAKQYPDRIKLKKLTQYQGHPIYRVDVAAIKNQRQKKAPTKVLLTSGVHGNEPTGVKTTISFLNRLAKSKTLRSRFEVSFIPMINPTGLNQLERYNDRGIDLNRSFKLGEYTKETKAVVRSLKGQRFDLAVDLHGAGSSKGFFLIGAKDDGDMSTRILSAMPSVSLLAQSPSKKSVYQLKSLGAATTLTKGTLKGFLLNKAKYSYTLEYPRTIAPKKQAKGMMRILRSALNNVRANGE